MQFAQEEKFYDRRHILKRGSRQSPGLYSMKKLNDVLLQKIPHDRSIACKKALLRLCYEYD